MKNLIIFDLDGVITSEESYWDCAGLTLHELLYSPRYWRVSANASYKPAASAPESREISRATLPEWLLQSFKARALNSNWDTCYAAVCLHLLDLLSHLPERATLLPLAPGEAQWHARLREALAATSLARDWDTTRLHAAWRAQHPFDLSVFQGATGLQLFERLDAYASEVLALPIEGVFARSRPFWHFCQNLFQEWLLGDTLYTQTYGHAPAQPDKPGCLFFEESLLPAEQIRATLEALQARGYILGIASGRIFQEAEKPLEKNGLLTYFDKQHMGTYDMVTRGEKLARAQNITTMLGKPHPFHFQAAADWEHALQNVLKQTSEPLPTPFIAVGDSTSDILGGRAAGALTVAVLTGARTSEARELFLQSQPDFVIEDMTKLPTLLIQLESLALIQQLQFKRRETAEKLLHLWFIRQMDLAVDKVRLTPKAVSLNSFNGFYTLEGKEYFFKTHIEENGVLSEYYHAEVLDKAGYNVVRPLRLLREKDRQMVIYPVIKSPVMFDLMRAQETGQEMPAGITADTLVEAEREECRHLLEIYARTFKDMRGNRGKNSTPIHQLFWHRLTGGRFREFYLDKELPLPIGSKEPNIPFEQVQAAYWTINGIEQRLTLGTLIEQAKKLLAPAQEAATVVGHGDAHFGNVFLQKAEEITREDADGGKLRLSIGRNSEASGGQNEIGDRHDGRDKGAYETANRNENRDRRDDKTAYRYLYFDPAFAGHHPPLLDIVKPLFHNVFAMWMYFPQEIARDLQISVRVEGERIIVEHNYRLTPIRQAMLRTKQEELLVPLLAFLRERHVLPQDWQRILNLALMCCPLLTVDLFDTAKRPPEIGWLGLAQALQLGNGGLAAWKEEQ